MARIFSACASSETPFSACLSIETRTYPIVIDDHVFRGRLIEEPSQELGSPPFGRGQVPLAIAEDDSRLIARDHILELREHVLLDITRLVGKPKRVIPLIKRIIEAHLESLAATGIG